MTDRPWTDDDGARFWEDPGADPDVADVVAALEALGVEEDDDRRAPVVVLARRRRTTRFLLTAAAVLAVVVSAVFLTTVLGGEDGVVIAAGDGVTVVEEDGSTRSAQRGSEVPHGAVVVVTGFVDVGDGPLGPGRYRVDDGALVPLDDVSSETTAVTAPGTTVPSSNGAAPGGSDDPIVRPDESDVAVSTTSPEADSPERIDPTSTTTIARPDDTRPVATTDTIDPPPTSAERPVDRPATTDVPADRPTTSERVDGGGDGRPVAPPPTRPATSTTEVAVTTTAVERGQDTTTTEVRRDR